MAVIWRWFDVLMMVFFSLIDGPMVTMWFLGHSVVFLGRGSRCGFFFFLLFFVVAVDLVGGWWLVAVMVGGCGGCVIGGWMW